MLNIRSRTKTYLIPGEFSHTVRINMDIPALVPSEDDVPSLVAEDSVPSLGLQVYDVMLSVLNLELSKYVQKNSGLK